MANLLDEASILLTPTAYDNGRMLAVKPEIALGEELVVNGDFATDLSGWDNSGGVTVLWDSGRAKLTTTATGYIKPISALTTVIGAKYRFLVTLTGTGNTANVRAGTTSLGFDLFNSGWGVTDGSHAYSFTATTTTTYIAVGNGSPNVSYIDNVSVKEDLSGDFTFSRNSAATRVNAQGLVENVQILSSNLVSNGDFSQEGAEQVTAFTNGTTYPFSTFTSLDNNITSAIINSNFAGCVSNSISVTSSQTYKVSFNYTKNSGDDLRVVFSSSVSGAGSQTSNSELVSTSGSITLYLTISSSGTSYLQLGTSSGSASIDFSITNISVKEVGQDWTLGTGWSIGDGKAISDGTQTAYSIIKQIGAAPINTNYKMVFTADITSGNILPSVGGSNGQGQISASGTYTFYTIASTGDNGLYFGASADFVGSITNISVIEITDDTNLPRINYEGFSYQDSLGSELIVNGDFSNGSANWALGTGWSISGGIATLDGTQISSSGLGSSTMPVTSGKTYKVVVNVISTSSGFRLYDNNGVVAYGLNVGENVFYRTVTSSTFQVTPLGLSGSTGSIDNVSVKEYLGQEVVPNSGCGSWLLEPQSTNLMPYSEDFSQWNQNGASTVSNSAISPDGTLNADKITATNADPAPYIYTNVTATEHTFSFYYKGEANSIGKEARVLFWFIGTATGTTLSIPFTLTGDWQRFESQITPTGAGTLALRIDFPANEAVVGDYGYLWGAQFEQGSYATSYIPTQGAISTRLQDIANNSGNASLINSEEGVLYAEISAFSGGNTDRQITINDGTTSDRLSIALLSNGTQINFVVVSGGAVSVNKSVTIPTITSGTKIAFAYKANDFKIYANGVLIGSDTSGAVPIGLSNLSFDRGDGADPFYGKTKALAVYKTALTDAQLTALTTI